MLTERPIPGQSLTTPPKSAPYERPPETVDALEALEIHLDNLNTPEVMEAIIDMLESNIDLVTVVEGILRSAVMEAIHSIDISLMIAPHIHAFIKGEIDVLDVEYDEGFEDKEGEEKIRNSRLGQKILRELNKNKPKEEVKIETTPPKEEKVDEEVTQGLMARRE